MPTDICARRAIALAALVLLAACAEPAPPPLLGTLEWDRIALPAEASERVLALHVREGQAVAAGALLAELDPQRATLRLQRAEAELRLARARRDELAHGPRVEQIEAARAQVAAVRAALAEAERETVRLAELRAQGQVAQRELDRAVAARDRSAAELRAVQAALDERLAGTRIEQLDQAEAALAAASAAAEDARVALARLSLHAPRAGRVDALPFKPGDQPPVGATLVSLLAGEAPYARVFVPAALRAGLREGERFKLRVQGVDAPLPARLRSVASEPSFTPYYALAGDDAARLVYRAELVLEGDAARGLPAGLTLQAQRVGDGD